MGHSAAQYWPSLLWIKDLRKDKGQNACKIAQRRASYLLLLKKRYSDDKYKEAALGQVFL
jgi:hypothetical protein